MSNQNLVTDRYEAGVIVKLLFDNSEMDNCDVSPHDFTNKNYGEVYKVIQEFSVKNEAFDIITVCERLNQSTNHEWLGMLGSLSKDTVIPSNIARYAKLIKKAGRQSKLRQLCQDAIDNYQEDGVADTLIERLMSLNSTNSKYMYNINEAMKIALDDIDRADRGQNTGLKTGLKDIDKKLGGFHGGDLIIIGARPAMGKTSLLLNLSSGILNNGDAVAIFSGEQGISQIMQRLIGIQGKLSVSKMRNGDFSDLDWKKLNVAAHAIKDKNWNLHVYDKPAPSLIEIVRESRKLKHTYGIKVIFIDYIQRIKVDTRKAPMHEAIGEVAKGLKELARTLDIPVVCLAQVNRSVENRPCKRPRMSDLKDSGGIEQEADQVMMLYRDEVYNEDTPDKGLAELIVDKNRHGNTGKIKMRWIPEYMIFDDIGPTDYQRG